MMRTLLFRRLFCEKNTSHNNEEEESDSATVISLNSLHFFLVSVLFTRLAEKEFNSSRLHI
jgi:hypothetical protein